MKITTIRKTIVFPLLILALTLVVLSFTSVQRSAFAQRDVATNQAVVTPLKRMLQQEYKPNHLTGFQWSFLDSLGLSNSLNTNVNSHLLRNESSQSSTNLAIQQTSLKNWWLTQSGEPEFDRDFHTLEASEENIHYKEGIRLSDDFESILTGNYSGSDPVVTGSITCPDPDDSGSGKIISRSMSITETSPGIINGTLGLTVVYFDENGEEVTQSGTFPVTGTASLGNSNSRSLSGTIGSGAGLILTNGTFSGNWSNDGNVRNLIIGISGQGTLTTDEPSCSFSASLPMSAPGISLSISGRITTLADKPLKAITVTLSGGAEQLETKTDINGNYLFGNLKSGVTYKVKPTKPSSCDFTPSEKEFPNLTEAKTQDFTATCPDLTVKKVEPVQVIYGDDIPLIQGKPTAVRVTIKATEVPKLKADPDVPQSIKVLVNFDGKDYPIETFDKNNFDGDGIHTFVINHKIIPTTTSDKADFIVTVDPSTPTETNGAIIESDETNNTPEKPTTVKILNTFGFSILYVPINGTPNCQPGSTNCYPSPSASSVDATVAKSNKFIKGVYPIAPDEFKNDIGGGISGKTLGFFEGLFSGSEKAADFATLGALQKTLGYTKVFGIVSEEYWTYHGEDFSAGEAIDVKNGGVQALITKTNADTAEDGSTAAHELGHLFGIPHTYLEQPPHGDAADDGFWVDGNEDRENKFRDDGKWQFYCMMGYPPAKRAWIDKYHYKELINILLTPPVSSPTNSNTVLSKQQGQQSNEYNQSTTPQLEAAVSNEYLVITGVISQDGRYAQLPWHSTGNSANVDGKDSNDIYSVRLINASGQTISQASAPVSFTVIKEPTGVVTTDVAPFVVKLPYPSNAVNVQILRGEQVIHNASPSGKLLRDTINAIPNSGFNGNATQQLNDLLSIVSIFESHIEASRFTEARQLLITDLKPKVQNWLKDGYTIETLLQLTKPEVLTIIDNEIARLATIASTVNSYTIGGQITNSGNPLPNVSVALSGSSTATTQTDSSGNYSFANLAESGNYTIIPTLANYTFTPVSLTFNNVASNQTANFTSTTTTTPTPTPGAFNPDTAGVFRPTNGITYLRNTNTGGFADIDMIYGVNGDTSIAGDWNGDGVDSLGIYRNGLFYLRNSNTTGAADIVFAFGSPGDQPIAGDWDGDGIDTIGLYRRSTGVFILRNSNSAGEPDAVFVLGNPNDIAIVGDWDGDGIDTTGVFRPSNGIVYLKNQNTTGFADIYLVYGNAGDKPLAGDWDGDGKDSVGIYRDGVMYLRNSNTQGFADIVFAFGNPGDEPVAGDWDGLP